MRFLQGTIVGAVLVVAGAYYHDTPMLKPATASTPAEQPLVNWDQIIAAVPPSGADRCG